MSRRTIGFDRFAIRDIDEELLMMIVETFKNEIPPVKKREFIIGIKRRC
jgi:hypothetical protein